MFWYQLYTVLDWEIDFSSSSCLLIFANNFWRSSLSSFTLMATTVSNKKISRMVAFISLKLQVIFNEIDTLFLLVDQTFKSKILIWKHCYLELLLSWHILIRPNLNGRGNVSILLKITCNTLIQHYFFFLTKSPCYMHTTQLYEMVL